MWALGERLLPYASSHDYLQARTKWTFWGDVVMLNGARSTFVPSQWASRAGNMEGESCPGSLAQSRHKGRPNVFRRGHELFGYPALGEFIGGATRGVSDEAGGRQGIPVESQTEYKNEYGRA